MASSDRVARLLATPMAIPRVIDPCHCRRSRKPGIPQVSFGYGGREGLIGLSPEQFQLAIPSESSGDRLGKSTW